jgi:hypothetical protein
VEIIHLHRVSFNRPLEGNGNKNSIRNKFQRKKNFYFLSICTHLANIFVGSRLRSSSKTGTPNIGCGKRYEAV